MPPESGWPKPASVLRGQRLPQHHVRTLELEEFG
jgi:hypothetical protein